MQFTVRLPRWVATACAIVVATVAVAAWLPSNAASQSAIIKVCIDPGTQVLTVDPNCTGSTLSWNQDGVSGANGSTGATGATGPAGVPGPAGPAVHLAKAKPSLTARLEAALEVQASTVTSVNHEIRSSIAVTSKLTPSADPTVAALQLAVDVQGASIARLVNVLRALTKAQNQLLRGLE